MDELAYIPRNFRKCIKYKDLIKFEDFKNGEKITEACSRAYEKVQSCDEWPKTIHETSVKNKKAYCLKTPESILINNLVIHNIHSKYKAKCIDRDVTIRLLISYIRDSYAFNIHRLDVKSFYESFNRRDIIKRLKSDAKLSRKTLHIIERLFKHLDHLNVEGLPRGMGLSAALSELMMNDFDACLRSTKGVLFYSRFVDDIIILTTPKITKSKLCDIISGSTLPRDIEFHSKPGKSDYKIIKKTSESSHNHGEFDFLGYQFKVNQEEVGTGSTLDIKRRHLEVEISDEKIRKIKKRIINSFCKFMSSKQSKEERISILRKRLNFLSKNYSLTNASYKTQVLSGIYFNYKHVSNPKKISEIDKFYRSLLFGKKSNLSKRIRKKLSYKERYILSKISFLDGFTEKRFCKFSYKDFKEIKKVWI